MNNADQELLSLMAEEKERQETSFCFIASENLPPSFFLTTSFSQVNNKYIEGTIGKRWYGGTSVMDAIESLAIARCRALFGGEYVNVQPHAGTQANIAAITALVPKGGTILSMDFSAGGHLSHGHPRSILSSLYRFVHYGVNREDECIDYNEVADRAEKERPALIIAGASSYSRAIDFSLFQSIAKKVNALLMVDMAHIAGLVAAGLHQNPVPYADIVTSTTHKTLRGERGGFIIAKQQYAELINRAVMPGIQGGPFGAGIAQKAATFFFAQQPSFLTYQKKVLENTQFLITQLQQKGLRMVSGGSDIHYVLVDTFCRGKTGREVESILEKERIIVNRNAIPFDQLPPHAASGIRIGLPYETVRAITEETLMMVAERIAASIIGEIK